jgi:hypothetical protein
VICGLALQRLSYETLRARGETEMSYNLKYFFRLKLLVALVN